MRVVIQQTNPDPFLSAVAKALSAGGNDTLVWDPVTRSIYDMLHQTQPELLVVSTELSPKHWEVIRDVPYVVYGCMDGGNRALAKIPKFTNDSPGFCDKFSYRGSLEDHLLKTDILVSTNHLNNPEQTLLFIDKLFDETEVAVKATGNTVLPSAFFIGLSNEEEFTAIARVSKLVIASNQIEKASLLYNKIYACLLHELNDEILKSLTEEKLRRSLLKTAHKSVLEENRSSLGVVSQLLKLINKPEEAAKIEAIGKTT